MSSIEQTGNLILVLIVILVGIRDYKYGLGLGLIFIILIRFVDLISVSKKEAFELSQKSIDDFLLVQHTINPKIVFDIEEIKKQASQEELDYLNPESVHQKHFLFYLSSNLSILIVLN